MAHLIHLGKTKTAGERKTLKYLKEMWDLSCERESSEQFVWRNRRYGETETQLSRSAITPSVRVKMK